MIPAKPAQFNPEVPPPGFERKLISFWQARPLIVPRLQLVHTNGAPNEGSVEASYSWANQPGSNHTIPQFQVDRSGRAAMLLPLNRKGIANYKAADFSIAIETADTGTNNDPTISAFTPAQAESVALALAYTAWGYKIPLFYPDAWDGTGTACHTEPFGYPVWTNSNGKICPGLKKKAQVRNLILPRAREILAAWTAPPPPPPPPSGGTVLLYRVVSGDSYWKIVETVSEDGKATQSRVAALQAANGNKALRPDDLINVPGRVAV